LSGEGKAMEGQRFATLGPYDVPVMTKGKRRLVDFDSVGKVFDLASGDAQTRLGFDLEQAIGCYVIALSPSGSSKVIPYYVGQACRQTLRKRVFQKTDKPAKYNDILSYSGYERAKLVMFLFPLLTPSGRLARKKSNQRTIDVAEYTLIGLARRQNEDLWNLKHKVGMDAFTIDGVYNTHGPLDGSAKLARAMLLAS
jgi:hypothetical protein